MSDERYLIPEPKKPEATDLRPHRLSVLLSFFALIVALSASLFTFLQWRASDMQADIAKESLRFAVKNGEAQLAEAAEARRSALESAMAARNIADAMTSGLGVVERKAVAEETRAQLDKIHLKLNERALTLSESPSIEVYFARFMRRLSVDTDNKIQTRVRNVGKGIAYNVSITQLVAISKEFDFPFETGDTKFHYDKLIPVSQGGFQAQIETPVLQLPRAILSAIEANEKYIYVFGIVEYEKQILKEPERLRIGYCYYYHADQAGSTPAKFVLCPTRPSPPTL